MRAGPSRTVTSTARRSHSPAPATTVSRAWLSNASSSDQTAAIPPWARLELLSRIDRFVSRVTVPWARACSANHMPATPDPITRKSVDSMGRVLPALLRALPNLLTAARGVGGPLIAWLLLVGQAPNIAFWLFAALALSDLIDGWLARRWIGDNPIGRWLDPTADKLLYDFTWLGLASVGWAPWWLALTCVARSLVVAAVWITQARRDYHFAPSALGQVMVSFEGTALGILLFHGPWCDVHWPSVGVAVGTISLALSAASLIGYAGTWTRDARAPGSG